MDINLNELKTPAYVVDERLLIKNLETLTNIIDKTGCKILLAQKAFSMFHFYPLISKYLSGTTASSLNEARLGFEEMGKEVHIFSPAYAENEFDEIIGICDHIIFNSFGQWKKYKSRVKDCPKKIQCGIRINPEYAEVETDIYNPCSRYSRLGTTLDNFKPEQLDGIDGLHFHTMCEQNSDVLQRTLQVFEQKFGKYLYKMKWLNFGGGHHITREDYDIDTLIKCIEHIKDKYNIEVYLEPGEAIALNTGYLVTSVLDIVQNGMNIAILDAACPCHMPDVLEMPYRPKVISGEEPNVLPNTYRLGGPTCLSGDIIGDYSFENKLEINSKLVFCDMAHYTMVKNNTFNGINLPSIYKINKNNSLELIKHFNYYDFKHRLS